MAHGKVNWDANAAAQKRTQQHLQQKPQQGPLLPPIPIPTPTPIPAPQMGGMGLLGPPPPIPPIARPPPPPPQLAPQLPLPTPVMPPPPPPPSPPLPPPPPHPRPMPPMPSPALLLAPPLPPMPPPIVSAAAGTQGRGGESIIQGRGGQAAPARAPAPSMVVMAGEGEPEPPPAGVVVASAPPSVTARAPSMMGPPSMSSWFVVFVAFALSPTRAHARVHLPHLPAPAHEPRRSPFEPRTEFLPSGHPLHACRSPHHASSAPFATAPTVTFFMAPSLLWRAVPCVVVHNLFPWALSEPACEWPRPCHLHFCLVLNYSSRVFDCNELHFASATQDPLFSAFLSSSSMCCRTYVLL